MVQVERPLKVDFHSRKSDVRIVWPGRSTIAQGSAVFGAYGTREAYLVGEKANLSKGLDATLGGDLPCGCRSSSLVVGSRRWLRRDMGGCHLTAERIRVANVNPTHAQHVLIDQPAVLSTDS